MEFVSIKKVCEGKFITRYDITYKTADGQVKIYEMISRNKNIRSFEDLVNNKVEAVVMIMHDSTGSRILINKEFRMATGQYVYNFPAGLINPGEDFEEGARRELKEETGLNLISVDEVLCNSCSSVGFSNEKNKCIIGVAGGEFAPSDSVFEEIEAAWYTKKEVRELLKGPGLFAARTQAYCYLWSKED